jgi:FO synthase
MRLGHEFSLSYPAEAAKAVFEQTGLLPHVNPGIMTELDLAMLRKVSVSQGIMLESASDRLCARGASLRIAGQGTRRQASDN